MGVQVWIDADSCPSMVRNHVVKYCSKLSVPVTFVANKKIPCEESPFNMVICSAQKDAADNYILEKASPSDLVITRDIVFADRLVSAKISAINDRGREFTAENVRELLSDRDFDLQLSMAGLVNHYHEGYDKKKFAKFADCFDRVIHKLLALD